jgi:hypothetical protein
MVCRAESLMEKINRHRSFTDALTSSNTTLTSETNLTVGGIWLMSFKIEYRSVSSDLGDSSSGVIKFSELITQPFGSPTGTATIAGVQRTPGPQQDPVEDRVICGDESSLLALA